MYLVSKESNRKCRRSSDLKKLMYADGRLTNGPKVSGPKNQVPEDVQMHHDENHLTSIVLTLANGG